MMHSETTQAQNVKMPQVLTDIKISPRH